LERIIQYLKGTKELKLNLTAENGITINAFVDASFACHPDGKSHTGEMITLGGGAVISKSSKQKLVTRSSTEAELVGLSDATPTIL
ncbi:Ty1/Copia family ribonuclease HI, partial [Streptomyces scabiei]|uniref:Ty1/Copia family ribonuclease HI n=1 Tax=Streptomyces scabiei TaxID=1930 RepID=UPI0038F61695